jgi:hypothetical protein
MTLFRAKNKYSQKIVSTLSLSLASLFLIGASSTDAVSSNKNAPSSFSDFNMAHYEQDMQTPKGYAVPQARKTQNGVTIVYSEHPFALDYMLQKRRELVIELAAQSRRINDDLRKNLKERKKIVDRANKVPKNTTRFHPNATTNAGNRYQGWLNADRSIKKLSSPRAYAAAQIKERGWAWKNWACLDRLWWHESNWRYKAGDKSGNRAYGIPQAAPGKKMASAGKDWKRNPATQIDWGLDYIENRYGTPCSAWSFWAKQAAFGDHGWGWY